MFTPFAVLSPRFFKIFPDAVKAFIESGALLHQIFHASADIVRTFGFGFRFCLFVLLHAGNEIQRQKAWQSVRARKRLPGKFLEGTWAHSKSRWED